VVPGSPDQRTGGYLYGARVVEGLRGEGWKVRVHGLEGGFPHGDEVARASLSKLLEGLPDGARVVVDGLAMGGLPDPVRDAGPRLRIAALVHHPLAHETGLAPEEREWFEESEPRALEACRAVMVTSEFTAFQVEAMGVPPDRIRVVLPGTEPADPAAGPEPGEPPNLLTVASLTRRKGQDVLVRALDRIHHLDWVWSSVGSLDRDRGFVEEVQAEVRARKLQARVRFTGELAGEELAREYRKASLFVLPSHYEGYGMVLAEAMMRGLPVVATTGGAVPYTVPSSAGVLVAPGDEEALAGALERLLGEEGVGRRERLARAALSHSQTLPDWATTARTFGRRIEELLGEGEGANS
jgi:glycosyltransferase involved in cell wall biosynthesis